MAATPDRLANVLEQYRDKLHQAGDNVHEEELDYIKEILASPIFNQYLLGNPPSSENSTLIAEATNELITGIQDTKKDSPTHKRKVLLQRKESLKILRNAVTPKNVVLKRPHRVDAPSTLVQPPVLKLSLTPSHTGNSRTGAIDGLEPKHTPEITLLRQASLMNGSSDDSIVASILNDVSMESSLNNSRIKNLSSSTSTLVDRSATNGGPMLRKKSSESFLRPGSGGSLSGSQPNISTLRSIPHMAVNSNHVSRPEPIGAAITLDPSPRPTELYTQASGLTHESGKKLVISPETRPPPPSYHAHMQKQFQHSQEPVIDSPHPLLPYRKTKSVEKLFDMSETSLEGPHLHSPQQPPALTPPTHPMTNGSVTMDVSTAEKRKTTFTVRLDKGAEGLGFMVKAVKNEAKGEVGLSIQDLQAGGIAKRDGRLRRNDQISHINGHSLSTLPHSDAVSLLQSSRGPVELVVIREHPSQATPPSPPSLRHPPPMSPSRRHTSQSPAAHRHMITKPSSGQPDTQSPPSPPPTPTPHPRTQQDIVNGDLNEVTGDKEWESQQQQIVTIELPNDGRRGFGFGIVSVGEPKKTVVHSLVSGGVAEQDGQLQREDQLLQINEESVLHMEYDDIITRLRTVYQAGQPIRLVIARTVSVETSTGEVPDINDSSDDDLEEFEVELHRGNNKGLGITIAGLVNTDTGEEVNGIYITSMNPNGAAAQAKRITVGDRILKVGGHSLKGLENMEAASVLRNSGNPVKLMLSRRRTKVAGIQPPSLPTIVDSNSEDPPRRQAWEVVDKWTSILGPDYVVKVDEVYKTEGGGLGIRMESTAELDEEGEPHSGSVHHVIQYIHPQGPVGHHGILRVGDEILEINGSVLVGLQHQEAIEVVKYTPNFVQVVVCRVSGRGEGAGSSPTTNSPEGALSDSEEDKLLSNSDTLLALPSCDLSGLGDNFSRRLERKSWRVRHEQQKKLIKQRFEQKREEFLRHLQEQDEELVAQEAELKERQRQAEEEERMKSDEDHNRDSALLQFDYASYRSSSQMSGLDESLQSPDSILDSDSSLLSPVPGSTLWEDELSEVVLEKGNQGLGFSILDFADPLHSGEKVILIHSLVEGGAAETDGGLKIGDKLLSVNNMSVLNHSLDFAVQQLVAVPLGGIVSIGVYHPLPGGPELESELCSPYSMEGPEEGAVHAALAFERASLGQDDEDQKPLSDEEEEPEGVATEAESEGQDNPEEEEGDDEKKKKPDTDDDEPPPPYSKDDPQDEKSDDAPHGDEAAPEATNAQQPKLNSGGPQEHVSEQPSLLAQIETEITQTKLETHSADDIDSPHMDTPSPLSPASPISPALLSRISSPEKGRSLSDLTRIKPEEGARLSQPLSIPVPKKSSCTDSVNEFSHESLSSSDNTIVNSQSQPSQSELGPESNSSTMTSGSLTREYNTTPVYVSSPSSDRSQRSIKSSSDGQKVKSKEKIPKRTKGKRLTSRGHKTNQTTTNDSYPSTPTQENLTVNYSSPQGILCSSQESNVDGLSPELSDFGDHSSEVEPREIRIRKIGAGYGMNLAYDEKNSCVIVKSLSSSGAVGRDGRIRAGDRITAINGKSLAGFNLTKARGILKRASTRSEELIIVYTPAPQVQSYIIPSGGSPYINTPGTRSSITEGIMPVQQSSYYPQGIQGAQGNIQLHPVMAPGPQYPPHGMIQSMYGAPTYHPPGVPPPPNINVPGGYFTPYEDQMSKPPPPPYMFPHQPSPSPAPPMMSQGPPHPYPAQQPPTWNLNTPSSNGHIIQHSPIIGGSQWPGMSHSHMTPGPGNRDPPQYSDIHMMAMQQSQSQPPPLITQPYVRQPPPPPPPQAAQHFEHPPHLNQPSRPEVSPRPMNKSQSETRFRSGMPPRPKVERRHNTVSHAPKGLVFNGSGSRKKHRKIGDDVFEDKKSARRSKDEPMGPLSTHTSGKKEGKKDTQDTGRPAKYPRTHTLQESPEHSHHNSWAIEEEEDPAIRAEFPEADGHLFEVLLQKGKAGLGLSIVASTTQSLRGIVIMGIQPGGVAELCGRLKWGDMILKVNDTCVLGMSQQKVQELLAKAPPTVRFVLLRQHKVEETQEQQKGKHTQADSDISLDGLAQVKAVTLYTDDKKSLGFNIEKGELVGGAPSVLISNISPGGPAEVSNSLQAGDQILSVDGQKILGYAYDKARLLLQQARQRGQVTVVVASHSSTTHKDGEGRGVELDKTRLPEEVVLRPPKRRKSSLKQPSRRRPVSVDCDGKTGPKMGSPGILQRAGVAQVDSNRVSYYSNRSSQPLTEREVEQGFQYFEQKDKDITPLKECEIIIFMGTHDLGLVLTGGMDSPLLGIYIQCIVPGSPADKDGRLKPGDQIKMVNNTAMEELTRDEAMQTIKTSPAFVHLLVLRETSKSTSKLSLNEVDSVPPFSPADHPSNLELIELVKPNQGGLGLMICEQEDHPLSGVFVQNVVQNKAAYLDGRIHPGDKILAINGQDVSTARQDFVVHLLQSCGNKVSLKVLHPPHAFTPSHPPHERMEYGRSGDLDMTSSGDPKAFQTFPPPPEYPYGATGRQPTGHDRIIPPYARVADSTPTSDYTPEYMHHQYVGGYRGGGVANGDTDIDMPVLSPDEKYNVQVIHLHRGPSGLGFSIVGGKGSKHGDLPIYVKSVFEEGAAGQDGRLRLGDQILTVNGHSFESVTHKQAVETLKQLKGDIKLTVMRTE